MQLKHPEDLEGIGDYVFGDEPRLADEFDWSNVPQRADSENLRHLDIEAYVRGLPRSEQEGLIASDDQLALAIFSFMSPPLGDYEPHLNPHELPEDLVYELGRQYRARGRFEWWTRGEEYPFPHQILRADEMSLYEIYQRRARADFNIARVSRASQGHPYAIGAALDTFSLDEICEMLLVAWFTPSFSGPGYMDLIKPLLFAYSSRIRPPAADEPLWYAHELERLEWEHEHYFDKHDFDEKKYDWPTIISTARRIAQEAHATQRDKAGEPYIGHPTRVADNVYSYERMIWQHDVARLLDQGGEHIANVIDGAITAAWLHDVIEDSGDYGQQVTAQDLLAAGIPAHVVDAVVLLTDDERVPESVAPGIQRRTMKTRIKLDYYARIKANEIARIVKLADLADNNNLARAAAMRAAGGAVDPAKYPLALASLELSPNEWGWFNRLISKG
jgi:hypothetical protein